jgi:hypothetical protein
MADETIVTITRCWLFKYVADALLDRAFGGSVEKAAVTCTELAGVEYGSVGEALVAAARPFDMSVAKAAKRLLGCPSHKVGCGENTLEHCAGKIKFQNDKHRRAFVASYNIFADLNQKLESVSCAGIDDQESLQRWLRNTFAEYAKTTEVLVGEASFLVPVARQQIEKHVCRAENRPTEVPNCIFGTRVFFHGGPGEILSSGPEQVQLASAAADCAVDVDPAWGFTFFVQGTFERISFSQ